MWLLPLNENRPVTLTTNSSAGPPCKVTTLLPERAMSCRQMTLRPPVPAIVCVFFKAAIVCVHGRAAAVAAAASASLTCWLRSADTCPPTMVAAPLRLKWSGGVNRSRPVTDARPDIMSWPAGPRHMFPSTRLCPLRSTFAPSSSRTVHSSAAPRRGLAQAVAQSVVVVVGLVEVVVVVEMRQVPPTQTAPAAHALPAQHGSPAPPHATQLPATQTAPAAQVSPAQHGSPAPPHGTQLPALQIRSALPHALPAQQTWLAAPHGWQVPSTHTAPVPHASPLQHGSPAPPHATQLPPATQVFPAQHGIPASPHAGMVVDVVLVLEVVVGLVGVTGSLVAEAL